MKTCHWTGRRGWPHKSLRYCWLRDKWKTSRENYKIGETQTGRDQKRPVFGENSPRELTGTAQCVVKCTAKGLCQHPAQGLEEETGEKKPKSRMKLGKKTHGFRSQELGGMRRPQKTAFKWEEREQRERMEVLNKRETWDSQEVLWSRMHNVSLQGKAVTWVPILKT